MITAHLIAKDWRGLVCWFDFPPDKLIRQYLGQLPEFHGASSVPRQYLLSSLRTEILPIYALGDDSDTIPGCMGSRPKPIRGMELPDNRLFTMCKAGGFTVLFVDNDYPEKNHCMLLVLDFAESGKFLNTGHKRKRKMGAALVDCLLAMDGKVVDYDGPQDLAKISYLELGGNMDSQLNSFIQFAQECGQLPSPTKTQSFVL